MALACAPATMAGIAITPMAATRWWTALAETKELIAGYTPDPGALGGRSPRLGKPSLQPFPAMDCEGIEVRRACTKTPISPPVATWPCVEPRLSAHERR